MFITQVNYISGNMKGDMEEPTQQKDSERTRETDPYRRPLARNDGSETKADRGPVAPHCIRD